MSKLVVGSATDVGLVRSNNQDQFLVAPGLYAVADGMGGHAAGEVASSTAVQALASAFQGSGQRSVAALEAAAKAANRAVWEQARTNRHMLGMGTTLVVLALVERTDGTNGLAIAHIGDSRAYQVREGRIRQLTVDHSLVQELVDDGQITPAQAAVHPQRHVLTRALGVEPNVLVDLLHVEAQHGDRYLLCSDGLPREASDDQIAAVLNRFEDPDEAAKELVALAKARGGSDNITVVVVDVLSNDQGPSIEVPAHGVSTGAGPFEPVTAAGTAAAPAAPQGLTSGTPQGLTSGTPQGTASGTPQGTASGTPQGTAPGGAPPGQPFHQDGGGRPPSPATRATDATAMLPAASNRARTGTGLLEAAPAPPAGPETAPGPLPVGGNPTAPPPHGRASARPRPAVGAHMASRPARWLTWRVAAFFISVCLVVAAAVAGLAWYARSTYYVQLEPPTARGHLTIFQGRPGGVLWFAPTVVKRTRYTGSSVQSSFLPELKSGVLESSLGSADRYVHRLVADEAAARRAAGQGRHRTSAHPSTVPARPSTGQGTPGTSPAGGNNKTGSSTASTVHGSNTAGNNTAGNNTAGNSPRSTVTTTSPSTPTGGTSGRSGASGGRGGASTPST